MPISLEKMDIAPIDYTLPVMDEKNVLVEPPLFAEFPPEFKRWLGNFVDIFNQNMQDIEDELASLDARLIALGG